MASKAAGPNPLTAIPESTPESSQPNLPALRPDSALAAVARAKTPAERAKAQSLAGTYTTSKDFKEPVPAFFLDLPLGDDDEALTDSIALANLVAEDPDAAATGGGSVAFRDLVGKKVTVWDLRVRPGGMGSGWNAYLLLDITVDGDEVHQIANTGAKQVVVRLARAYAEGQIPVTGVVTAVGRPGTTGNQPLAFIVETDF